MDGLTHTKQLLNLLCIVYINNIGVVSAGKIIELRARVLLESSPLITTKDLAEIRLDVETWNNLIKDSKPYQGRPEYGRRSGHSPGIERNIRERNYSLGYSRLPNYRHPGRNHFPYREQHYNSGDRDKYSCMSDHG